MTVTKLTLPNNSQLENLAQLTVSCLLHYRIITTFTAECRNNEINDRNTGVILYSLNETWLLSALVSRVRSPEDESDLSRSLVELLERESQSEVFLEGISYALFKVAERGLVYAAEILLRFGADLNFEGEK